MFSDLSLPQNAPSGNHLLPFPTYIEICRNVIAAHRDDLKGADHPEIIINANSPFELTPTSLRKGKFSHGVLFIHGLFDSPFTLHDLGRALQEKGIFSRAILLPGHGTTPKDLMHVSYEDWVEAVRYGVESMRETVDELFLVGYSTGAALSVYQALRDENIAGIVLLSPAIRLKAPVDIVVGWRYLMRWMLKHDHRGWVYREPETDYAKYHSITFNAVWQVSKLTKALQDKRAHHALHTPIFMVVSQSDETISPHQAIQYFSNMTHARSKLLLYSSCKHPYKDQRIITRNGCYPELNIDSLSHICIPFAPHNSHYGENGDYCDASHLNNDELIYGAYNRIEVRFYDQLHKLGLLKKRRRELTYNPDFKYMSEAVSDFIFNKI